MSPLRSRLTFMWSQPFTTDELKRRPQLTGANFTDFLEMLGRMCTFLPMVSADELKLHECESAKEYYDNMVEGKLRADVLPELSAAGLGGTAGDELGFDWFHEENSEVPLAPDLRTLITLVLDRLDDSGDGKIDRRDLEVRRRKMMIAQERLLVRRGTSISAKNMADMLGDPVM